MYIANDASIFSILLVWRIKNIKKDRYHATQFQELYILQRQPNIGCYISSTRHSTQFVTNDLYAIFAKYSLDIVIFSMLLYQFFAYSRLYIFLLSLDNLKDVFVEDRMLLLPNNLYQFLNSITRSCYFE